MTAHVDVRVPATTANLGPGFDCLAMALDLWNECRFELAPAGFQVEISGEGAGRLANDERNLLIQAFTGLYQARGAALPAGLRVACRNAVPLGSGMGSSASAVVAGLLAANHFLGGPAGVDELLVLANELEGHPDNAAAALYGGLVVISHQTGGLLTRRFDVPALPAVIVLPDFGLPTREARAALPKQVTLKDAIFNLGRSALVVEALRSQDLDLLGQVMDDRLHQPYRLKLIPGAENALNAARQAGAAAAAISGAGPSLIAFLRPGSDGTAVAHAMQTAFRQAGLPSRAFALTASNQRAALSA